MQVHAHDNIPATSGVLIGSNHQSLLNPILLPVRLVRPLNYIAKSKHFENRHFAMLLHPIFNEFPVHQGFGNVRTVRRRFSGWRKGPLL